MRDYQVYTGPVSIALAAHPGGATLGGTLTVNAVGGVATFGDLSVDKAGTGYTLRATAAGLPAATSAGWRPSWRCGPSACSPWTRGGSGTSFWSWAGCT